MRARLASLVSDVRGAVGLASAGRAPVGASVLEQIRDSIEHVRETLLRLERAAFPSKADARDTVRDCPHCKLITRVRHPARVERIEVTIGDDVLGFDYVVNGASSEPFPMCCPAAAQARARVIARWKGPTS